MIPLRDTLRSQTAPVLTVALIALNALVFVHERTLGAGLGRSLHAYGLVPARLVHWPFAPLDPARFLPLFTSMFWHGGVLHLLGNLLYLWIFGDNVEELLGHFRYAAFYLLGGLGAALAQVALSPESTVPTVGASGAIAAVLGAYLVSFPRSRVLTFIPVFFLPWLVEIPAVVFLVAWFALQVASAVLSLHAPETAQVAFGAHAGGFVTGIVLVKLLRPARRAA